MWWISFNRRPCQEAVPSVHIQQLFCTSRTTFSQCFLPAAITRALFWPRQMHETHQHQLEENTLSAPLKKKIKESLFFLVFLLLRTAQRIATLPTNCSIPLSHSYMLLWFKFVTTKAWEKESHQQQQSWDNTLQGRGSCSPVMLGVTKAATTDFRTEAPQAPAPELSHPQDSTEPHLKTWSCKEIGHPPAAKPKWDSSLPEGWALQQEGSKSNRTSPSCLALACPVRPFLFTAKHQTTQAPRSITAHHKAHLSLLLLTLSLTRSFCCNTQQVPSLCPSEPLLSCLQGQRCTTQAQQHCSALPSRSSFTPHPSEQTWPRGWCSSH